MTPHPAFSIRNELLPGDIGAITRMHGELYALEYGWTTTFEAYVAEGLARFVLEPANRLDRVWIAETEGRVVGSIAIVHQSETVAQLRWFLIDPSTRGIGLGHRLISEALEFCRDRQFDSVFLWTVSGLHAAAHLYRSAGFVVTAEKPMHDWGAALIQQRYDLTL
ncbi:MAG TPA: GNAT family N-acetyltransferase [Gemmatimonadaceae bacterium]